MKMNSRRIILAVCAAAGVGLSLFSIPGAYAGGSGGSGGSSTSGSGGGSGGGEVDKCAECVFDFIKCEEKAQQGPSQGMPNMKKKLEGLQKCIDELKDCEFDNLTEN